MRAHVLSRRNHAVGFAIVVSIIMLGVAALTSVGAVVAPGSPSGETSPSSTVTNSLSSSVGGSSGPVYTVSLGGSSVVVVPSSSPTPSPNVPNPPGMVVAAQPPGDPPITLTPTQGPSGASVVVSGTGWTATRTITTTISAGATIGTCGATVAAGGTFTCPATTITGTASATPYTVTATQSGGGGTGTASFTITTPTITMTPTQGPVGATYTVTGTGFSVSSVANILFNSARQTPVSCSIGTFVGPLVTTDATGDFACTFAVPAGSPTADNVVAEDYATNTPSNVLPFTVTTLAITLSSAQGPAGMTVTVSGTGFSVTSLVGLNFDGVAIPSSSCTAGSLTTGATGAFSCTLKVPSGTTGTTVTATDAGGQSATGMFTVTIPTVTLVPTQGLTGVTVTASGSGFTPGASIAFTISAGGTDRGRECMHGNRDGHVQRLHVHGQRSGRSLHGNGDRVGRQLRQGDDHIHDHAPGDHARAHRRPERSVGSRFGDRVYPGKDDHGDDRGGRGNYCLWRDGDRDRDFQLHGDDHRDGFCHTLHGDRNRVGRGLRQSVGNVHDHNPRGHAGSDTRTERSNGDGVGHRVHAGNDDCVHDLRGRNDRSGQRVHRDRDRIIQRLHVHRHRGGRSLHGNGDRVRR